MSTVSFSQQSALAMLGRPFVRLDRAAPVEESSGQGASQAVRKEDGPRSPFFSENPTDF
jgi:hypothetical protein